MEPDAIEEAEQPRRSRLEGRSSAVGIPHLHGAPDELVATRPFHPVDAQVRAADADRVLGRPGARRVVLRGHQPVSRVHGRRHRRAEVDVAEPQHQVVGAVHDLLHVLDRLEPVDAADELGVARTPRRVGAHRLHVLLDREQRRRVFPRQRQMHDTARDGDVVEAGQRALALVERRHQLLAAQHAAVVVDLQRPDSWRDVDDAAQPALAEQLLERVNPYAQVEAQLVRPRLDEQIAVAGRAMHGGAAAPQHGGVGRLAPRPWQRAGQRDDRRIELTLQARGLRVGHQAEADGVARPHLPQLPQLRLRDDGRAHEAAQARAVGAEQDRHVAGEVHRADGVGVVVEVRRVQPGFAPVAPCPRGPRTDQANAGAVGVVVDLPRRREERRDVALGEEVGGAVRTVEDADLPLVGVLRCQRLWQPRPGLKTRAHVVVPAEHVAHAEHAPGVAAELPEDERGAAAEIRGHVQAAANGDVGARAGSGSGAEPELGARLHLDGPPPLDRHAIELRLHVGAAEGDDRVAEEAQARAGHRALETRGGVVVADQAIDETERQGVHGSRRRHADVPEAGAARVVLHGRLHARVEHLEGARPVVHAAQEAGGESPGPELGLAGDLPQVVEVRLEPGKRRRGEGRLEPLDRLGARGARDDDLGQHRIVVRRHFGAALHPGVAAHARRQRHVGEQPRAGAEVVRGVLGVDAHLDRRPGRRHPQRFERRQRPRAEAHHPVHDVHAGHLLGDPVLDLQARVDLEEKEVLVIRVVQELHRARRPVAHGARQHLGGVPEPAPHVVAQPGSRRFFDHLLVAALRRAVPLAERDDLAGPVAEDLHLDVARPLDEPFQVDATLAEVRRTEARHRAEVLRQLLGRAADAHADAAASSRALQDDRIAAALRLGKRMFLVDQETGAGQQRRAFALGDLARHVLEAERAHLRRRRPQEHQPGALARLDEPRVLAEETVAGVDRLRAGAARGLDDGVLLQVALDGRRRTEPDGGVGLRHVGRVAIGVRVDGDRRHAHPPQRPDDPAGDGAAVGDEDPGEHQFQTSTRIGVGL